jgi:spore germination cell wall hydrolase CwlJ-like protein|tara:strand:+ start:1340 stop:1879 length:540 start_codon:yes stop_codon:yes gene_type:complete
MRTALLLSMILISPLKVQGTAIDYDYDIDMHGESFLMTQDTYCMALNIYHESRSENLAGKFAVADVVVNRLNDRRYPNTICGVIYDAELKPSWKDPTKEVPVRNRCQFSWYCDGKPDEPTEQDAWNESILVAHQLIFEGRMEGITEGATHYHTTYVEPYWATSLDLVGHIGTHIFYREN